MHCVLFCCLKLLRFCFNILQIDVLIFVKQQQFFFTYISCFCIIIYNCLEYITINRCFKFRCKLSFNIYTTMS